MVGYAPPVPYVDLPSTSTAIYANDLNAATAALANLDCTLLPCQVATTASVAMSGTGQVIDTVTIAAGMRVFNKDDSTSTNRGIYVAGSGAWARSGDLKTGATFKAGTTVVITKGSQANFQYDIAPSSGTATGVVGTDGITVNQISGGSGGSSTPSPFAVRAATTTLNGTVTTGPQVVDGVSCAFPDRVLYKDSSTPTFNGIYVVQSSGVGWLRSTDMGSGVSVPAGSLLSITEGTVNGGREYLLGSTTPGATGMVIGTDPLTFTQISPNNSSYLTIARNTGMNAYLVPVDGHYFLTIDADNPVIVLQSLYDNIPRVVTLVIVQDATGHPYQFSPSHIAWENGLLGPGNVGYDTSPLSQTIVRMTWLGINYGFYGEILNSLLPLYWSPIPTSTLTYSGTGGTSGGFGGTSSQLVNMLMYFARNVSAVARTPYLNGMMHCTSAAIRQRLLNNGVTFEVSAYGVKEGPAGMIERSFDLGGSPQYMNRAANASPPPGCVYPYTGPSAQTDVIPSTGSPPNGTWFVDGNGFYSGGGGVDGMICHELCHAIDANYYTGTNTPHATYGAIPIRSHPPLWNPSDTTATSSGLYQRCVANGGPAGNNVEWFAEMLRNMRIIDNGSASYAKPNMGSVGIQVGTGTTSNTPVQRQTDFVNYINSLGLV